MTHFHACDAAGHFWECEGNALRAYTKGSKSTPCICLRHGVSMDDGDHSRCPIELLACPEHRDNLRSFDPIIKSEDGCALEGKLPQDRDRNKVIGFCLWCELDFCSIAEMEEHGPDGSEECPVLKAYRTGHASEKSL